MNVVALRSEQPSLAKLWTKRSQTHMLTAYLMPLHGEAASKEIAARLIGRFGSLPSAITAHTSQIMTIENTTASTAHYLNLLQDILGWASAAAVEMDQPILSSWSELLAYCKIQMSSNSTEQFRILFLNKRNRLIADEVQQTGTVDHTPVYPREVIKRALELSATALILVHNHPSGDPTPSSADVRMTREIADTARPLGITIHDHLVIGKSGHASLKSLQLF